MDLEQESCKIRKILASLESWHGFGTDFLPTCQILKRLGKILQDIFDRVVLYHETVLILIMELNSPWINNYIFSQ